MDEIELKYTLDLKGHNILKERFKASMKLVIDARNFVYKLGDENIIRLREEKFKGSTTHFLTYKQGKSRSTKVMLRIEDDTQISVETYVGLMSILPAPSFSYETLRHVWEGYDGEEYQLDQFRFEDGTFYLYEVEIEFEDINNRANIEHKAEALFKSLGINYSKGNISKYDRYRLAQIEKEDK